jgi:hypothetical protein
MKKDESSLRERKESSRLRMSFAVKSQFTFLA